MKVKKLARNGSAVGLTMLTVIQLMLVMPRTGKAEGEVVGLNLPGRINSSTATMGVAASLDV